MPDTLEDAYKSPYTLGILGQFLRNRQADQKPLVVDRQQQVAPVQSDPVSQASVIPMPQRSPWQTQQVQSPQVQRSPQADLSQAVRSPAPTLRPTAPSVPAGGPAAASGQAQQPWGWRQGQKPQWPIPPVPQGVEPLEVAAMRLGRNQLDRYRALAPETATPFQDPWNLRNNEANRQDRLDLYKRYHGGWNPGEYEKLQELSPGGAGGQAKQVIDPTEKFLRQKIQNPTASYQGGIPISRGGPPSRTVISKDADGNPVMMQVPLYSSSQEWADTERNNAMDRLAALERNRAEVAAADPNKQIELLDRMAADPRRLGTALAYRGHDPEIARRIPSPAGVPAYGLGNLEQAAQDPETAYLHQALGPDSQLDLPRKLDLASRMMESGNPKYKDYMRGWLQRQQALDENWKRDVGGILNAPQTAEGINQSGIMHFLGGLMGADRAPELARNRRARQVLQMFPGLSGQ